MRRNPPMEMAVYPPKSRADQAELARRISEVHAEAVSRKLQHMNIPRTQKIRLIDEIIHTIQGKSPRER